MPLFFGYLFHILVQYVQHFGWALLVVLSAGFGLAAGMHWSCLDKIVLGLKSVEELYPSPPFRDDSADHRVAPGDAARSEQGIAAICSKM